MLAQNVNIAVYNICCFINVWVVYGSYKYHDIHKDTPCTKSLNDFFHFLILDLAPKAVLCTVLALGVWPIDICSRIRWTLVLRSAIPCGDTHQSFVQVFIWIYQIYNVVCNYCKTISFLWPPYGIGQAIIFSWCGFYLLLLLLLLLSSFPRLISAVRDWMSTILLHMVWP